MKFKKVITLAMAAILALGSTACGSKGASDGDTVKVGFLHSLTGSMAISEEAVRDAEVLAIEEINESGGVLGKQIEYVEEDGASELAAPLNILKTTIPTTNINKIIIIVNKALNSLLPFTFRLYINIKIPLFLK